MGLFFTTFLSQSVFGQACQGSDAGSATYNSGWTNGLNDNATGYGAWQLSGGSNAGFFIASSNNNDAGTPGLPNINTVGRSWGMFANSGQTASATRPFATAMAIGHSISYSMDNGGIDNAGPTVGMSLQNASGENLMELYFRGGQSNYELNDGTGNNFSTGLSFTRGGIDVTITRTAISGYSVKIVRKESNTTVTFTRNFFTQGGGQIPAQIRFFNFNAGGGGDFDAFFNNLSICRPTITGAAITAAFTTTYGTASAVQTFSVSGTSLFSDITATAPTGFEVSNDGVTYGGTATFTQSNGSASGSLRIRLKANAPVSGTYNSQTIILSSTGATSATITTAATGNSVTAAALTITGVNASNKPYDGNTTAALSGTAAYSGLVNGETFTVTGTPSASFITAAAGTGKAVTVTGYTAPSTNYTVSQPIGLTATISQVALTIIGVTANNKEFDRTTTATLSGTAVYSGLVNGEMFTVTGTPLADFNNSSIGTNKPVTVTGYTAPSANYTVSQPTGLTANITGISFTTADYQTKTPNANFSSGANWEYSPGDGTFADAPQAPTPGNNITILHAATLDQDFTVANTKTFSISGSGTLAIASAKTFAVASGGSADFGGNSVTVKSGTSGTGSIGKIIGTLTGASQVTVERYIPASTSRAWRLLGVPTSGSQTIFQSWQENAVNNAGFGTIITRPAAGAGYDAVTTATSIYNTYTAATNAWTNTLSTTNVAINPATATPKPNRGAYFLYVRGDRSKGVTGLASDAGSTTLRTTGSIFTGSVTSNGIASGAFAVLSNPYVSAIDFTLLGKTASLDDVYYIWDSKKIQSPSLGFYQTFTSTNGFAPTPGGGSYASPTSKIESGQAFFVHANTDGATVSFTENAKIASSTNLGFRPATPANELIKFTSKLYSGGSTAVLLDGNDVVFDKAYSNAIDIHDAKKLPNGIENFGISREDKILAVEGRQPINNDDVISFKLWNLKQQAYQFELTAQNLTATGLSATLEDSYLSTGTPLSLDGGNKINFTVDANAASSATNRFRVVFKKAAVPVNVAPGFTVSPNPVEGGMVNLQFKNKSEGRYTVRILSSTGQLLMNKVISHAGGSSSQLLTLPAGTARGQYRMEVIAPDKSRALKTLFVNSK